MTKNTDDATSDLLIKEVDEELRQDQLNELWKRYGSLFVGGAVALVLGVAGWQGWTAWQTKQGLESSHRYAEAQRLVEQGKTTEAADSIAKLAAEGASGYKLLSTLERADLRLKAGDTAGAIQIYDALIADGGIDEVYRDLVRLKAAYLKLDSADAAQVAKSVEALTAESSPWRHSAREIQALAALKQGDHGKAADIFRKLAEDPAAPEGIKSRAAAMAIAANGKAKG
ncbi:MAG TPA: tetratricopeptide repeat protein [Candidatus Omnitrophota bacterium]|nr:tetratricopeptide repeat protein [Candidatus Omnitrophota bacterium]